MTRTMKVLILAAGKGTRMKPLTHEIPKPLIPVNGKPFLQYLLDALKGAGCKDIAIVVGYKKEMITDFCGNHGIDAEFIIQEQQLGTGHAIGLCEEFAGDEEFIVVMGDNLYSKEDIASMEQNDAMNYVAAIRHDNPEKFGVLVEENGFLNKIVEKPANYVGTLINTGLYKFTPEIFEAIRNTRKSETGEYFITDAITLLAGQKKVKVKKLQHYWLDLGCYDDIEKVARFLIEKGVLHSSNPFLRKKGL